MPITFDASLSYYETLMKVIGSQNNVIEEVNQQETEIDQIQADIAGIDQMQEEIVKLGTKIDGIQANISSLQSKLNATVSDLNAMNFNYTPAYTNLKITLGKNGQISWAQQNTLILIPANAQSGNGLGYSVNSGSITVGKAQRVYLYLLTNGAGISQIVTSNNPPLTINRDVQPAYPNYFALGFIDGFNSIFVPYACFYVNNKLTCPYENLNNTTLLDELDSTVDRHSTQISGLSSQLTTTTNTANDAASSAAKALAQVSIASGNGLALNTYNPIKENIVQGMTDGIMVNNGTVQFNSNASLEFWTGNNGWITVNPSQQSYQLTTPTANSRPQFILDFNDNQFKVVATKPDNNYLIIMYSIWTQISSSGYWAWITNLPVFDTANNMFIGRGGIVRSNTQQIIDDINNLKTNFVPPYMPSFTLSFASTDYTSAQQIVPITFADEQNARNVMVDGSNAGVTGNAYVYIQVNTQTNQGTIINSKLSPSEIYSMNVANTKFAPIAYLCQAPNSKWTYITLATFNDGERIVAPYEYLSSQG